MVSGVGVVSAWGWGVAPFRSAVAQGGSAIGPFTRFEHANYPTHVAAQVPNRAIRPRRSRSARGLTHADRFAVAAADEALAAAGLPAVDTDRRTGVFFGGSTGGMFECEEFYRRWRRRCLDRAPRHLLAAQPVSRPAEAVARSLRVSGPVETVSSACASAALAIGVALEALRAGEVQLALAGGSDSLCRITFGGFNTLRAIDERPCRPFRADRAGMSLGEGSAVLVLESLESARGRGARPLVELCGAGASADAHHMTAPDPGGNGASLAIRRALRDAAREPGDVDLINAHGTGTPLNDIAEYRALERVFGDRAREIPLAVTKGSVGHLLGGAGAIEAAATVHALLEQRLQPVPGQGPVEPRAPVQLPREAVPAELEVALSLNLGFGGCNAALVFARWSEP